MKKIDIACVIDDDPIYQFAIKRLITATDFAHKTIFFQDGQFAIDFFKEYITHPEQLPDLILLDINMPVLDGWQFMDAFVGIMPRINKKIIIFMVSSSIDELDHKRAKSYSEISDFIIKPVTPAMLKDILNTMAHEQA